ncbi:DnaA ATPase domain-containing protein [Posidoniimonas polymericola]|nr:DnaA/Hda family protein [Posidoniimonas polymericola]
MPRHDDSDDCSRFVSTLRQLIGEKRHRAWFAGSVEFDLTVEGALTVRAGSTMQRDCLKKHFKAELREACRRANLGARTVEFVVDAEMTPQQLGADQPAASASAVGSSENGLSENGSSANGSQDNAPTANKSPVGKPPAPARKAPPYLVSDSNREAARLAELVAAGSPAPCPVILWGPGGSGKTHLLRSIAEGFRSHHRRKRVVALTAEQFTSGFVEAVHGRTLASFRGRCRGVDLLLIDDIHFLLGKQKTLEELQYTLDTLASQGAMVVLTSDRSPAELRKMSGELLSRLGAGVAVEIAAPDLALKHRLTERFADQSGVRLEESAVRMIASGVIGGAWEIRGIVNKLGVSSRLLDLDICDTAVGKAIDDMNRVCMPSVGVKAIQDAVCQVFGVESGVIKSKRRTKSATEPRMLAMWLARKYTRSALSEIGDQFGSRSHSTVVSACKRVEQLMGSEASVQVAGGACRVQEAVRLVESILRTA